MKIVLTSWMASSQCSNNHTNSSNLLSITICFLKSCVVPHMVGTWLRNMFIEWHCSHIVVMVNLPISRWLHPCDVKFVFVSYIICFPTLENEHEWYSNIRVFFCFFFLFPFFFLFFPSFPLHINATLSSPLPSNLERSAAWTLSLHCAH